MAATDATKVYGTVITSSPGPIPAARSAKWRALVPEFKRNALGRGAIGREFLLEGGHFGAENELGSLEDSGDGGVNLRLDALILRFQVEEGNLHGGICHSKPWLFALSAYVGRYNRIDLASTAGQPPLTSVRSNH